MTVNNIAGMAALKGLQIIALTDHNSCKNCSAFFEACKRNGLIPVAGMELTTAEEIHLVCLFETLTEAEKFDEAFQPYRLKMRNKPEIFGNQLILNADDEIIGNEEYLLPPASMLSLEDAYRFAKEYGAYCYPAHVDRPANGILGILGALPEEPQFDVVEYSANASVEELEEQNPSLKGKRIVKDSDAHYLWDISEAVNYIDLPDEPYSSAFVRKQLFRYLRGEI